MAEMDIILPKYMTDILTEETQTRISIRDEPNKEYFKCIDRQGEITFNNGNLYKGDLYNGMLHYEGELVFEDGAIYKGNFEFNHMHGEGILTYPNGNVYEGCFKNGKRHGKGTFASPRLGFKYEGTFTSGKMDGIGKIEYSNNSVYEGEVRRGRRNGDGKMTYSDGDWYKGGWSNNRKQGYGVMEWVQKEERYSGLWSNNLFEGEGTYLWLCQNRKSSSLINRYKGDFKNGKRHGIGIFYYADGSQYEGQWFQNMKDGFAVFTKDNGDKEASIYSKDRIFSKLDRALMESVLFHSEVHKQEIANFDDVSLVESIVQNDNKQDDANKDESKVIRDSQNAMYQTFGVGLSSRKKTIIDEQSIKNLKLMPNFYYDYVDFTDFMGVLDPTTQILITKNVRFLNL